MPILVQYCCNIFEAKEMAVVTHIISVERSFVKYMRNGEDIISGKMADDGSVRKTKRNKSGFLKSPKKNTGSVENVNNVAQEMKANCGQRL